MGTWTDAATHRIVTALEDAADPDAAVQMAAYMRDQFTFHGLTSPVRDAIWREVRADVNATHGPPDAEEVLAFAEEMWAETEREHHYVGAKELARVAGRRDAGGLLPEHLDRIRTLIVTHAWWDTVDILAPNVVGPLARTYPTEVVSVLDRWLVDEDVWLIRTAVLHQLKSKEQTDPERLARYCRAAAPHTEFFVRKAIGWALRQYSYVDPPWVEAFVAATDLSGLSEREALKAIRRERRRT